VTEPEREKEVDSLKDSTPVISGSLPPRELAQRHGFQFNSGGVYCSIFQMLSLRFCILHWPKFISDTNSLLFCIMALQLFVGPWLLFQFPNIYIVGRTPWTRDQPVARPLTCTQYTNRINAHRHICLELDSNPRPRCLSGRRQFMSWTARPL
jgi:hypothetical protein